MRWHYSKFLDFGDTLGGCIICFFVAFYRIYTNSAFLVIKLESKCHKEPSLVYCSLDSDILSFDVVSPKRLRL